MTMTVQSALRAVASSARRLRETVGELVLTATEDQPRACQAHLVTVIHDAALDVGAEAEQAAAALYPGRQAGPSLPVAQCQAHVNALGAALVRELAAPERLSDLTELGREHGREAAAWAGEIVRCVQACQHVIWTDVQPALLDYWQELADSTDRSRVSGDGR
jgi:hypothetical protein